MKLNINFSIVTEQQHDSARNRIFPVVAGVLGVELALVGAGAGLDEAHGSGSCQSGPTTVPLMFRKFRKPASLSSASTMILPLSPTCVVLTSKSALIGGRATPRTTCAQNLLYAGDADPCARPLVVRVAGEDGGLAQARLPVGQDRVVMSCRRVMRHLDLRVVLSAGQHHAAERRERAERP